MAKTKRKAIASHQVYHDYHLVDPSPWPVIGSVGAFTMLIGAVFWMHETYNFFGLGLGGSPVVLIVGLALVLYTMAGWWRDVTREGVVGGHHKPVVRLGFRYAMILFIISEVMFFFAWFWAYFNSAIFPTDVSIGSWPPEGIATFDPWRFPLLNTLILLTSGTTVTWAHHAILTGDKNGAVNGLALTIALGMCFTGVQIYEYSHAEFTFGMNGVELIPLAGISDAHSDLSAGVGNLGAIYGSTFFMVTGFHGLHVVIGTIFLTVCLFRTMAGHFTPQSHFGFEAAAWYWHFVDVVWLFLFASIYVWGAGG
jgi:cytochrome c oxidase subunit 3